MCHNSCSKSLLHPTAGIHDYCSGNENTGDMVLTRVIMVISSVMVLALGKVLSCVMVLAGVTMLAASSSHGV